MYRAVLVVAEPCVLRYEATADLLNILDILSLFSHRIFICKALLGLNFN